MSAVVYELLSALTKGKQASDYVFTRTNGRAVRNFLYAWHSACAKAGVPGLLFHVLRRTSARNMRRAGLWRR